MLWAKLEKRDFPGDGSRVRYYLNNTAGSSCANVRKTLTSLLIHQSLWKYLAERHENYVLGVEDSLGSLKNMQKFSEMIYESLSFEQHCVDGKFCLSERDWHEPWKVNRYEFFAYSISLSFFQGY